MAKVWVEGYTKKNGTKVKDFYRDLGASKFDRTVIAQGVKQFRSLPRDKQKSVLKDLIKANKKWSHKGDLRTQSLTQKFKTQIFAKAYGTAHKRRPK